MNTSEIEMTTPKVECVYISSEKSAVNNVIKDETLLRENRSAHTQNEDEANAKHSVEATRCPVGSLTDSLAHKMEKLCVQDNGVNTTKAVTYQEVITSNIDLELCEKSELYKKPDNSLKEMRTTPLRAGSSQRILETDNHQENEMVVKKEVTDVQANSYTTGKCKNDHKSDAKEVASLKKETGHPSESMPESTNKNGPTTILNKRKYRQIMKKKMQKDERKRQRELEFLKNLVPKEQRVQVVDHNTFQKILKDSNENQNKSFGLSFDEFPALTLSKYKDKLGTNLNQHLSVVSDSEAARDLGKPTRVTESHSAATQETIKENEMSREFESKLNHVKLHNSVSKSHNVITHEVLHKCKTTRKIDRTLNHNKQMENLSEHTYIATDEVAHRNEMRIGLSSKLGMSGSVKKARKPPKKRDPIKIDIVHCIKMVRSKDTPADSKKRSSSVEKGNKVKESSLISGNELDASNPQRSKGKKREQPRRKKPSKLKLIILNERELKNQLKELQNQKLTQAKQEQIKLPESKDNVTAIKPELNKVKCNDPTQESENHCPCFSSKDLTPISCDDQSSIYRNDRQHILHTDLNDATEQLSTKTVHVLSPDLIKKEKVEVDSRNHSLSIMAANKENKRMPLPNVKNECQHYSQNGKCQSSIITYGRVNPNTHTASLQGNQKNSSTYDDENKFTPLQNVNNVCHSLENKETLTTDVSANPLKSSSHGESQGKPSTYKVSDSLLWHNEQIIGLHTRRFRPYCDHMITEEINNSVQSLLQDIVKFHDRHYERDPVKANARRRHVTGLREVLKYLNLKRLKLVIIAPDLEIIEGKGGICDIVTQLKEGARMQEIPHVFALNRKTLGKITFKKVPVSCIGIISYDGTEKNFHTLMESLPEARNQYQKALANSIQKNECNHEIDVNRQVIASMLSSLTEKNTQVTNEEIKEDF